MFKTMWNMPAKLLRLGEDRTEPLASGSLGAMIRAAEDHDPDETLVIQCAGRDRPITWPEIEGLKRSGALPADA